MTLPLAHHAAVAALPVFGPALIVLLVVAVNYLRNRGEWEEEDGEEWEPAPSGDARPASGAGRGLSSTRS